MRTAVVSDLHLGSAGGDDLLSRPRFRELLASEVEGTDRLVLLGDVLELRDRPLAEAIALAAPFFEWLAETLPGDAELVVVPGNHDHHLLSGWMERRRLERRLRPLGLEERSSPEGCLATLAAPVGLSRVTVCYPGCWLRDDIYAMHGHYLDRHMTIPTFERLGVGLVERVLAGAGRAAERSGLIDPDLAEPDPGSNGIGPDRYERIQAPVYELLFALAQASTPSERGGGNVSQRVWGALSGGYGRAAKLRGWMLGSVALPGAVGVANRLGLGPVRSDLSPGAITRAGIEAVGEAVEALGIEAEHVLFGHTHRRGPLSGEEEWRTPAGARLHNTGSWVFSPGLAGPSARGAGYWPGTVVRLGESGPPTSVQLLDEQSRADLRRRD